MCARFQVEEDFVEYGNQTLAAFDLRFDTSQIATGDFYPTYQVTTLRFNANQQWTLAASSWGLVPASWRPSKDAISASEVLKERKRFQRNKINARSETADTTWPWKFSFRTQRCLMLATSFFEPHVDGGQAQYRLANRRAFFIPALWSRWESTLPGVDALDGCVMLTTDANDLVRTTRSGRLRQPIMLTDPEDCRRYCSIDITEHRQLENLFEAVVSNDMRVEHLPKPSGDLQRRDFRG